MNLLEIKQAVMDETKRVDRADQIHRLVREAITTVHSLKLFPRDMEEDIVDLNSNKEQQFKIQLPPRWREFECISPRTNLGSIVNTIHDNNQYERVRPRELVDNSFNLKTDIYYITGSALAVRASVAPAQLYLAWYAQPDVADNYLETWLMELCPQVFIDTAKKLFYRRNGREDLANSYDRELREQYFQIISDYAEGD